MATPDRANRELAQRITPLVAVEEVKTAMDLAARLRPTTRAALARTAQIGKREPRRRLE